jgi:hypothetical protein
MLIFLYNCLYSTHRNCPTATHGVFNFLYKVIADSIIFIIHVLRPSNTLCRPFFHNTIKFFKNITLHIKLKIRRRGYKLGENIAVLVSYVDRIEGEGVSVVCRLGVMTQLIN